MSRFMPFMVLITVTAFVLFTQSFFVVNESQQALVIRLGDLKRVVANAGLSWKVPFIDKVMYLDNRVLTVTTEQEEVIAADQKRLVVDVFARYRIVDPILFYQSVRAKENADRQLRTFLSAGMRRILGKKTLFDLLSEQRVEMMGDIRSSIEADARKKLGVEVVDVRIRKADLPETNLAAVYRRMQAERRQQAEQIRAEGNEQFAVVRSHANRKVAEIMAHANKDSEIIRGQGDAEKSKIFAESYSQDPQFFAFYRSMLAYREAFGKDTQFVLNPSSEFLQFMDKVPQ